MQLRALTLCAIALTLVVLLGPDSSPAVAQLPGLPGANLRQVRFHLAFGESRTFRAPVANTPISIVVATTNSVYNGRQLGPFVANYDAAYDSHTGQWSMSSYLQGGTSPPDGNEGPNPFATLQFLSGGDIRVVNDFGPGSSYDVCANIWY